LALRYVVTVNIDEASLNMRAKWTDGTDVLRSEMKGHVMQCGRGLGEACEGVVCNS
jgi:hypothetical protein